MYDLRVQVPHVLRSATCAVPRSAPRDQLRRRSAHESAHLSAGTALGTNSDHRHVHVNQTLAGYLATYTPPMLQHLAVGPSGTPAI